MRRLQKRRPVAALSGPVGAGKGAADDDRPVGVGRNGLFAALGIASVVVAIDQVTKSLAVAHLRHHVHLLGPLGLGLGYNTGSAFSLFVGRAPELAVVAVAMIAVLGYFAWRSPTVPFALVLGLILGGAIGNLCDRLFRGHHGAVVDFVTFTHWPTFNVADSCITVGIITVVILLLRTAPPRKTT